MQYDGFLNMVLRRVSLSVKLNEHRKGRNMKGCKACEEIRRAREMLEGPLMMDPRGIRQLQKRAMIGSSKCPVCGFRIERNPYSDHFDSMIKTTALHRLLDARKEITHG